jgi:hypothetical protein
MRLESMSGVDESRKEPAQTLSCRLKIMKIYMFTDRISKGH